MSTRRTNWNTPTVVEIDSSTPVDVNIASGDIDVVVESEGPIDDTAPAQGMLGGAISRAAQQAAISAGNLANLVSTTVGELVVAGYDWANGWLDVSSSSEGDLDSTAPTRGGLLGLIARTSQQTAVAAGDLVNGVANAYGEAVLAGYDWASNLLRVQEQNPLSEQYTSSELVDDTSVAADTYDYILTQDGYKGLSLTYNVDAGAGGTVDLKIYGTNDDAGSPEWVEITGSAVDGSDGSVNNSIQDTGTGTTGSLVWENCNYHKVKVEVVVATAAADQVSVWARQTAL